MRTLNLSVAALTPLLLASAGAVASAGASASTGAVASTGPAASTTFVPPSTSSAPPGSGGGATQRLDGRFAVGDRFPDFALPSLEDGAPTRLSDFRGRKVMLHVFASW